MGRAYTKTTLFEPVAEITWTTAGGHAWRSQLSTGALAFDGPPLQTSCAGASCVSLVEASSGRNDVMHTTFDGSAAMISMTEVVGLSDLTCTSLQWCTGIESTNDGSPGDG